MARPVRQFEPTWFDRQFRKDLKELPAAERDRRIAELAELARDLSECRHPTHDPCLTRWRPSAYHVPKVPAGIKLYEYRGKYPLRVIARWLDPSDDEPTGLILLVAVTLSHDDQRLKQLVAAHRSDL
jgi:hypothetical protein